MKKLLLSLFIVGLIAACKSPTSTEPVPFESFQVGTWLITSPTTAEWIGKTTKAKGDTTIFNSPTDNGFLIEKDTTKGEGYANLTYIDSSITYPEFKDYSFKTCQYVENGQCEGYSGTKYTALSVSGRAINETLLELRLNAKYACDNQPIFSKAAIDTLRFHMINDSTKQTERTFRFNMEGFKEAMDITTCN